MKVLIIKTSSMGDIIHTLPALTDASNALAHVRFDWVVEESFAEIPAWHAQVDQVIPIALRRWRKHPFTAYTEFTQWVQCLRKNTYDYVIDAQSLLKSAILTRLSRGTRCGLDFYSSRESLASLFYERRYPIARKQHAIARIRQLFSSALHYPLTTESPNYGIDLARLPNTDESMDKTIVFIHGTSHESKCWPEMHWIELARLAQAAGYRAAIVWGSREEKARSERIAAQCSNTIVMPKLKLSEVARLLSQSQAAVAVDTGLGHLAAALNTPTISLYGPTDPQLIGTFGTSQVHLKAETSAQYSNSLYPKNRGLKSLEPQQVWQTLKAVLPASTEADFVE